MEGRTVTKHSRSESDLRMFVVYEKPKDYPDEYVIREHIVTRDGRQLANAVLYGRGMTLAYVRTLLPNGLRNIGRFHDDDPVIMEVWI